MIALADNKGTTWHSGVYGNELSEHVLGAWQIYQHTGDVEFLRDCYEAISERSFASESPRSSSNHFEVAEALIAMAQPHRPCRGCRTLETACAARSGPNPNVVRSALAGERSRAFLRRPKNGMLMTTGFWHMRSKYFPRDYALKMTRSWALDKDKGFYGDFFPLAMSRQAMKTHATKVDHSFGYTPDTAYFTLDGMFRQRLGDPAWRLTLNHLENYNFSSDWNLPLAPEAYTRSGELFGDQYSNFNAGKILLYLEGLAGLEYSIPDNRLVVHDTMPADWQWMEVRIPVQMPGEQETRWPVIRFDRSKSGQ